ncbi:S1 RNA-binding domain-containing protein [Endozoicomonas sp. SM1973]|uniref:S1 RNA-binding domain-containing protein n=1 Tax=Spartinivicinus marinus TaxID=2994442 RepID=A0A853I852_9GAMM|nr:S1 RNA-binding domain-containing protein [Spartinivicinus marinus]MCX4030430.1 S1 RNA-binding domain-containing protein [Spartinivicinus marinus]NYZ70070.1 S1 RNA-binding domain-containing protein [Spartinivicinus marinus]
MISKVTWNELKNILKKGSLIEGVIKKHEAYGVFVDIGYNFEGLIQITDFKDSGVMTPNEYPAIGEKVEAVVLGFKENNQQIWLGVKNSQIRAAKNNL